MATTYRVLEAARRLATSEPRDESIRHLSRSVVMLLERQESEQAAVQERREAERMLPARGRSRAR